MTARAGLRSKRQKISRVKSLLKRADNGRRFLRSQTQPLPQRAILSRLKCPCFRRLIPWRGQAAACRWQMKPKASKRSSTWWPQGGRLVCLATWARASLACSWKTMPKGPASRWTLVIRRGGTLLAAHRQKHVKIGHIQLLLAKLLAAQSILVERFVWALLLPASRLSSAPLAQHKDRFLAMQRAKVTRRTA